MDLTVTQTHPFRVRRSVVDNVFGVIARTLPQYRDAEVSVVFVDNRKMAQLNRTYRHRSGATDVLSFAERETKTFGHASHFVGEIIIAYPHIARQARQQSTSVHALIERLIIHGFLHLVGYDHQTDGQYARMHKLEQKIISKVA